MKKNYLINTITILFLCFALTKSYGQHIVNGKIINEIDDPKEIVITNTNRNTQTTLNNNGAFEIAAFINDTITISSLLYEETSFITTQNHIDNGIEITLNDTIENLQEIIIESNTINDKKLAQINTQLQNQIKNDIKNNPYKYRKPKPGGNLFGIVDVVVNLLRKKEKETKAEIATIKHKDLIDYFENDQRFLIEDLKIPENQINYFFLFIEEQKITNQLLTEQNTFYFLEKLTELSDAFINVNE